MMPTDEPVDRLESLTLDASTDETGVMGETDGMGDAVSIIRSLGDERGLLTALSVRGGDGTELLLILLLVLYVDVYGPSLVPK